MTDDTDSKTDDAISDAIAALRERASHQGPSALADEEASQALGVHLAVNTERRNLRILEALLFAASEPLDEETLIGRLPLEANIQHLLATLAAEYEERGVRLVEVGGRWRFETAPDLADVLTEVRQEPRKLSQAALETLSIIAYHQPVTRAEIEEIRGVAVSRGTLDLLFELRWIRPRGRRRTPGRPVTYGTTSQFLEYFSLSTIGDLPGMADLKAAGLLDARLPPDFTVPDPGRSEGLDGGEDPLDDEEAHAFHVDFMDGEDDGPDGAA
ncbi:SMC-Scp complex subunit ScpB [Maricaulis sp.]|uniref:SMC-Scp complex subunit ScpB n=1 Tax=Maricaulis sp. TaxID=1486257 RepID=UPI00261B7CAD|nr:SMC-Scp complex subunit ScpB [Maricaulis sp.]